jgi:hypothetical protein
MDWQLMETAPKDGTPILVVEMCPNDFAHIPDNVYFLVAQFRHGGWDTEDREGVTWGQMTFWHPLPELPAEIVSALSERAEGKSKWRDGAPSWVQINPNQLPSH